MGCDQFWLSGRTTVKLKLGNKRFYPHLFLLLAGSSVATAFSVPAEHRVPLVVSLIGVFTGFVYFLYRQHLDETKLFKELFLEFNKRYDALNNKLNASYSPRQQITLLWKRSRFCSTTSISVRRNSCFMRRATLMRVFGNRGGVAWLCSLGMSEFGSFGRKN